MENGTNEIAKAFLTGRYVYLRPPERKDVEGRWYQWFNDPLVTRYLKRGAFPNTYETQVAFYEHILKSADEELILAIMDRKTDRHVGVISLRPIEWINRTSDITIIIGEKDFWTGYHALEAMALLTDHAFTRLNLNKLRAYQHVGLNKWRKKLEILGYQAEAVLKQEIYTEGKYQDIHVIAVFAQNYLRLKEERQGNILNPSIEERVEHFLKAEGFEK